MRNRLGTILMVSSFSTAFAAPAPSKVNSFQFKNKDIVEVVEAYAKMSGEKVMIDPSVRGSITILGSKPVSNEEAFDLVSDALAINSYSIIDKEGIKVVIPARDAQRSLIPVTTELPALKPERMVTWVYQSKYVSADEINKSLRILASKNGEIVPFGKNQMVITDWASNIHKINKILTALDRKN